MKLLSRTSDTIFSVKFGTRRETCINLSTALGGKITMKRLPLYKQQLSVRFLNFLLMLSL